MRSKLFVAAAVAVHLAAGQASAATAAQWRLADAPVFETGRNDGVWLHNVRDAAFAPDGSLWIADNSEPRILRVSATGEVVEARGRKGNGPGEFIAIGRVFSLGDTVLAFDSFLNRVTTWVGDAEPEVVVLPKPDGVGTTLAGVASAKTWVLSTWGGTDFTDPTSLLEVWQDILAFDGDTRNLTKLDRRHVGYSYLVQQENGATGYNMSFLGKAHVSATHSRWLLVPIDEPALLLGGLAGAAGATTSDVPLPWRLEGYRRELLQERREEWLSVASGPAASRIRQVFDNLPGELPAAAPPVRRLVHVGSDVWLQKFGDGDETGDTEWVAIDPSGGNVRATASIDGDVHLLGGSDTLAVVVVKTELDEEVVQARRIVR